MLDLAQLLRLSRRPKILVIGDAMLDRYVYGQAERISPEAPVLVLRTNQREVRLGGSGSVAALLSALEADVTLAAVVGDDHDGRTLSRLLEEAHIETSFVFVDPGRPTTTKERFLGHSANHQPQQILRVDTESRTPLDCVIAGRLLDSIATSIAQHSVVLISDYAKGLCTPELVSKIISWCRELHIPVLVDPAHGADFAIYRGATLIKPNRLEAEMSLGYPLQSPEIAMKAAQGLRTKHDIDIALITLDRDGLVYASTEGVEHQTIVPKAICDITGAGDTVLATLGFGFAVARDGDLEQTSNSGLATYHCQRPMSLSTVARIANVAAGLQVAKSGVTPIPLEELLAELDQISSVEAAAESLQTLNTRAAQMSKQISMEEARRLASELRHSGLKIVFTNGCFDLLHVGHVAMLEESSQLGDVLFVAINSDASVRRLKGQDRPVIAEDDRAAMLAALKCVDYVLIFDDDTPVQLLEAVRPDVLVKGGTTGKIVGREIVEAYGGNVVHTSAIPGWSTTSVLRRARTCDAAP